MVAGADRVGGVSLGTVLLAAFLIGIVVAIVGFVIGETAIEIPGLALVVIGGLGQVLIGRSSR